MCVCFGKNIIIRVYNHNYKKDVFSDQRLNNLHLPSFDLIERYVQHYLCHINNCIHAIELVLGCLPNAQ